MSVQFLSELNVPDASVLSFHAPTSNTSGAFFCVCTFLINDSIPTSICAITCQETCPPQALPGHAGVCHDSFLPL